MPRRWRCICILLAYPAAYFLTTLKGRWRYALLMLLLVPLLMSYVIKIYAIRSILGLNGFLNKALVALGILQQPSTLFVFNMNAILLTLTLLLIPFAILPIFLSLERIPQALLRASDDLGASGLQTFLRITLPLSLPGVASAASFVFVLAIGDFLTPQMVGGISGFTFGRILYSQFGTAYNWPFGAALSVALAAVVICGDPHRRAVRPQPGDVDMSALPRRPRSSWPRSRRWSRCCSTARCSCRSCRRSSPSRMAMSTGRLRPSRPMWRWPKTTTSWPPCAPR